MPRYLRSLQIADSRCSRSAQSRCYCQSDPDKETGTRSLNGNQSLKSFIQGVSRDGTNYPISQCSGITMRNRSKRFLGHVSTAPKNYRLAVAHRTDFRTSEQTLQKFFIDGLTIAWSNGADMRLKAYTGQLQST